MMQLQSRLIAIARRSSGAINERIRRLAAASSAGRTADPDVHGRDSDVEPAVFSGEPDETKNVAELKPAKEEHQDATKEADPFAGTRLPLSPSPKIESSPVRNPSEPSIHQKRNNSSIPDIENVCCAGLDGSPWPKDADKDQIKSDEKSYLSGTESADSRKLITWSSDETAEIGWKPEQLDTAEEALLRAARIWKENAMRGDPDAPHSRVLRKLRGEL